MPPNPFYTTGGREREYIISDDLRARNTMQTVQRASCGVETVEAEAAENVAVGIAHVVLESRLR